MIRTVYIDPTWKLHTAYRDMIAHPPQGYRYVVSEGAMEGLARVVSSTRLAPWFISEVYKWVPITLLKSYLDRFTRRPPKDAALTYSLWHIVFREEPWVIDLYDVMNPLGPYPTYFHRFKRVVEKAFASNWCRKVICVSQVTKGTVLANLDCSSFADKIDVLPPAIAPTHLAKDYINDGKVRLLFMGSANMAGEFAARGGRVVLEAFRTLHERYPNLELTIRSDVPPEVRRQVINAPGIRLLDSLLPFEELEQEWLKADIFLFPGYYASWRVILEAMAYELPVIVIDVPCSTEYVVDGQSGVVLARPGHLPEYGERMVAGLTTELKKAALRPDPQVIEELVQRAAVLIEDSDLRRRMGKAGRWEVEQGKFSIEKRNEKLKRIFDEAIDGPACF